MLTVLVIYLLKGAICTFNYFVTKHLSARRYCYLF